MVIQQEFHPKILALNLTAMARLVADMVAKRHFKHRIPPKVIRSVACVERGTNDWIKVHRERIVSDRLKCRGFTPSNGPDPCNPPQQGLNAKLGGGPSCLQTGRKDGDRAGKILWHKGRGPEDIPAPRPCRRNLMPLADR